MPHSANRTAPPIADHELLRCIGRGSYGEVWLARAVTGAWRAVKVVYREDFEDDHSFEREFQGILAYEPLSRRHQGLVEILHVGRNERLGFYFYVMELGDDQQRKQEIDPVDYQPRTLRGDVLAHGRYELSQVREIALQLAEAAAFLHQHELVHRDIKPANVIFVEGKAKLADIGLVAAHGQRTYVGTEGFSPPEGPGSAQGDVYALGKVIYELASGKDRMEFPAPPENFEQEAHRQEYLALDRIVCRAAEPRQPKRYADAEALATDLRKLLENHGLQAPRQFWGAAGVTVGAVVFIALLLGFFWPRENAQDDPQESEPTSGQTQVSGANASGLGADDNTAGSLVENDVARGRVRITSWPTQALVRINGIELSEKTNTMLIAEDSQMHPELGAVFSGDALEIVLTKEGYEQFKRSVIMPSEGAALSVHGRLEIWSPPQEGDTWQNHLGMSFDGQREGHRLQTPLLMEDWMSWVETKPEAFPARLLKRAEQVSILNPQGENLEAVAMPERLIRGYVNWLEEEDRRLGYLSEGHYYEITPLRAEQLSNLGFTSPPESSHRLPLWQLQVLEHQGEIQISSDPVGAQVFLDEKSIDTTQEEAVVIGPLQPGTYQLRLEKQGYQDKVREIVIQERGEPVVLKEILVPNNSVVFDEQWRNSVGMRFEPIDGRLMASVFETTRAEYQLYLDELDDTAESSTLQKGNYPIAEVTRQEAEAYAQWLTQRERSMGLLDESYLYRLPTDAEWSQLAELDEDEGSPLELAEQLDIFAWGSNFWPPPEDAANLGVSERDGYLYAAPVGQFQTVLSKLEDLSGNVGEWVSTPYDPDNPESLGVVRGGSFLSERPSEVWLSARYPVPPDESDLDIGFRLVLERFTDPNPEEMSEGTVGVDDEGRFTPLPKP